MAIRESSTFVIPGALPGYNEMVQQNRIHWSRGAKLKKEATGLCGQYIIVGLVPYFSCPVNISCVWYEKDLRRDADNVMSGVKFILDALVDSGRLKKDSRKWVKGIAHNVCVDKSNPRIEVTLHKAIEENPVDSLCPSARPQA